MKSSIFSNMLFALSGVIGIFAFFYPFFLDKTALLQAENAGIAPALTFVLLTMCLLALALDLQGAALNVKVVAALGVLTAIISALRFVEVAIPAPGGFSPIFAPILIAGYVFGGRFGFLLGALTMLVSGLITGGVGPWLPYQMFAAGWAGLSAGWLPHPKSEQAKTILLGGLGFLWGIVFGALMNLTFYPFAIGGGASSWQPGLGLWEGVGRFLTFYAGTSLLWDMARAVGNAALIFVLGAPLIRALSRFRRRFDFQVVS